jgi:hypothetical protein
MTLQCTDPNAEAYFPAETTRSPMQMPATPAGFYSTYTITAAPQ